MRSEHKGYVEISSDLLQFIESNPVLENFANFLLSVMSYFGLTDSEGGTHGSNFIPQDRLSKNPDWYIQMRENWNYLSSRWMGFEAPANYILTMAALSEMFQPDPKKPELVVSLGSGPGLYELFLAWLAKVQDCRTTLVCVDYAEGFCKIAAEVADVARLSASGGRIENFHTICGDMASTALKSASADHVICNNAIQWAADWKLVVTEMMRILNPYGAGKLYFCCGVGRGGITSNTDKQQRLYMTHCMYPSELLDELEKNGCQIQTFARYYGNEGMGQMGQFALRYVVYAELKHPRRIRQWRENEAIRTQVVLMDKIRELMP